MGQGVLVVPRTVMRVVVFSFRYSNFMLVISFNHARFRGKHCFCM